MNSDHATLAARVARLEGVHALLGQIREGLTLHCCLMRMVVCARVYMGEGMGMVWRW